MIEFFGRPHRKVEESGSHFVAAIINKVVQPDLKSISTFQSSQSLHVGLGRGYHGTLIHAALMFV